MKHIQFAACMSIILLISQFLAACGSTAEAAMATPLPPTSRSQTTFWVTAQRTPIPPPTRRAVQFVTNAPSQTPMPSLTPLPPRNVYVFPIQPPEAASFSEGVQGHGYPATDLFAIVGTKYVAVTNGVVEFVSTTDEYNPEHPDPAKRSGLAVAILGDDGLRYYGSHLSGIAPGIASGVRVKPGQVLGYVGASGDARGKDAHLHFGISHPTTPDDWKARRGELDPYAYLLAWKDGINMTPRLP